MGPPIFGVAVLVGLALGLSTATSSMGIAGRWLGVGLPAVLGLGLSGLGALFVRRRLRLLRLLREGRAVVPSAIEALPGLRYRLRFRSEHGEHEHVTRRWMDVRVPSASDPHGFERRSGLLLYLPEEPSVARVFPWEFAPDLTAGDGRYGPYELTDGEDRLVGAPYGSFLGAVATVIVYLLLLVACGAVAMGMP